MESDPAAGVLLPLSHRVDVPPRRIVPGPDSGTFPSGSSLSGRVCTFLSIKRMGPGSPRFPGRLQSSRPPICQHQPARASCTPWQRASLLHPPPCSFLAPGDSGPSLALCFCQQPWGPGRLWGPSIAALPGTGQRLLPAPLGLGVLCSCSPSDPQAGRNCQGREGRRL